jgi:hypothetical protein
MSTFISTEIQTEDIVNAMNENGGFCIEMWQDLAYALEQGLLLDNSCDALCADRETTALVVRAMRQFASSLESGREMRGLEG